ncbi:MAG: inositol monophosphatase family protein [Candidatus Komeilibacteria bacterium]|nr:inositol monophosphatase family protein [Candidatus Komeilibacteria bacterium]
MNFLKEKVLAKQMALEVGKMLKFNFPKFDRSHGLKIKSKDQIQTWVDLAAEKIILAKIKKHFPSHKIFSEEAGSNHKSSDYYWIIDPLDGTTNYSMHLPAYGVSIGLAYKNEMVLGVTFMPELNELTVAEIGKGAFINNEKIHVSRQNALSKSLLTFCHGSMVHDIKRAIKLYSRFKIKGFDFRQIGCAVMEFNFVAAGRTEAIMLPGANLYDVAAGELIVKEAGGRVSDFKNKDWNIFSKDILASNGLIHNSVLKIINEN